MQHIADYIMSLQGSDQSWVEADDLTEDQQHSTIDKTLRVAVDDNLRLLWGGVISQRAGALLKEFRFPEEFGLFFVSHGSLQVEINGAPLSVLQGQTMLIWPQETCIGVSPNESDVVCQWLSFGVEHTKPHKGQEIVEVPRLSETRGHVRIAELFRMLSEEYHTFNQPKQPSTSGLSSQWARLLLLSLLSRLKSVDTEEPSESNALTLLAERGRDYIRTCGSEPITTADVAAALDCSSRYLRKAFQYTYGYSPTAYILKLRLMNARTLLVKTRKSINQISKECGFESQNYFTRVFRRNEGVTPTQYRVAHSHTYTVSNL